MNAPITVVHYSRPKKLIPTPLAYEQLTHALDLAYGLAANDELVYVDETDEECLVNDDAGLQIALRTGPLQGLTLFLRPQGSGLRGRSVDRDVVIISSPKSSKVYVFSSGLMELRKLICVQFTNSSRAVLLDSETAVITGGIDHLHEALELSLSLLETRQLPPMNFGRFWHGTTVVRGRVLVSGGKAQENGKPLATCEALDTEWEQLPSLNSPRDSHTMCAYDSSVYVVGGEDEDSITLASIEKLAGGRWITLQVRLPEPRTMPGMVFLSTTAVVVFGGMHGDEKSTSFILNMQTGSATELGPLPVKARFPSSPFASGGDVIYAIDNASKAVFALKDQRWTQLQVSSVNVE